MSTAYEPALLMDSRAPSFCFNAHCSQQTQLVESAALFVYVPLPRITREYGGTNPKPIKTKDAIVLIRELTVEVLIDRLAASVLPCFVYKAPWNLDKQMFRLVFPLWNLR